MALGPFTTYVPPGVYTRTLTEANAANLVAGLRIPVYIGVGQEELEQPDLELVRGSSALVDQRIVSEDVSLSFVVDGTNPSVPLLGAANGTVAKFKVRNYPIVDGQGFGRVATNVRSVIVTVNGSTVAVGSVLGSRGEVTLQVPPPAGADIRCSYYFHRSDTAFTDLVSDQVSTVAAILTTPATQNFVLVSGTTDTFVLKVDGTERTMSLPAGSYTAVGLKSIIDALLIPGLAVSVFVDNEGLNHLRFTSAQSLQVMGGNANGALGFSANTATSRNRVFRVSMRPIVDGSDGGITSTDPSKVVVKVNGNQVAAESVDGANGLVTLPFAPATGSTVTIGYYANTWQDTFDYLPNTLVTTVSRCGFAPGRSDYLQNQDFVISNPSPTVSIIHWGSSYVVSTATRTPGATIFGEAQVLPTLVDDKLSLAECTRFVDTTVVPAVASTREFILPAVPTTGNGRDTPLGSAVFNAVTNARMGLSTNRPDLVTVYAGYNVRDAMSRAPIKVQTVDAISRRIILKSEVPAGQKVYATFWYSRLADDTYILTCKVPGAVGSGQYEVLSTRTNRNLHQIRFGTKSGLSDTVQWPRGVETIPDAFHTGDGTPVAETVTVTFGAGVARNAAFTVPGSAPYSLYAGQSDQWRTVINGTTLTTNLNTAVKGFLVSRRVALTSGNITVPASSVLSLTIDGTEINISLTAGSRTPAQIVTEINAAIDALDASGSGGINFTTTAPNALASTVTVAGDGVFVLRSLSVPAALPGGFDHASRISIRQGTVETVLGYDTFASATGTSTATNKPATMLGSATANFTITAGVNDTFVLRLNGIDYTVALTAGAARTATQVAADINGVPGLSGVASVGTLGNINKVRLTSPTNNAGSTLEILNGSSNETLGFSAGATASATLVTAQEIVNELLATASFLANGVAYVSTIDGAQYVTIESVTTGATASSVAFAAGSASAFNELTGTRIVAGTSGDNGEDASNTFTVTSNNAGGSAGTGLPGQTYTDVRTGLRFTILPASDGSYTTSGSFTLIVSPTFTVSPATPSLSLGGLETLVSDTVGVGVNDTATVQTFNPGGQEPSIGDSYFLTYNFRKTDFTTRLFQQFKTIEANFGRISPENRVTMAAYLAILNGAVLVGIKQVLKVPDTNQATDQDFLTAIRELSTPLPGNVKPDILVPLATSTAVYQGLLQHVSTQSLIQNQAERMGFIGFASGTSPSNAQLIAKSLGSNRIVAVFPDSAVVTLSNELGEQSESLVDGTFIAAALSGSAVSPAYDVATPYTRRRIQGFTRLPTLLDPIILNQVAVSGITVLEDLDVVVRVRQGLTTDMSTILTRLPTVTQIADYTHQQSRGVLDSFVGTKFLASRTNEVEVSMTALFRQLVQAEIVGAYTGLAAEVDPDDATTLRFEAFYQPIFPLLYLVLTFNLRARI